MRYSQVYCGQLVRRVNRFVAEVAINGTIQAAHVKNTGRLRELLVPGAEVILEHCANAGRKTACSLVGVRKADRLVNIDSQAPNRVVAEALEKGLVQELGRVDAVRREVRYGASRFDIGYRRGDEAGFIEVKGVTLERDGVAMFPDAPTERGTKHIQELIRAVREGYAGYILFLIQMQGVQAFTPNSETDPALAAALGLAVRQGVRVLAYDALVSEDAMTLGTQVKVII
ncbi:MAG TPA: DNA/RNA nuclease SfsA [Selenomonadales bacterium]|nr:DNA/RNA nuclease SfsA [Selenomonadales bacterium]